jgi:hypothetical protein
MDSENLKRFSVRITDLTNRKRVEDIIQLNTKKLCDVLRMAFASQNLSYSQICKVDSSGLYMISDGTDILYVGKTNRTGKVRMRELAADFRSHTFNKKLLSEKFKGLGFVFEILKNKTKMEWIDNGKITQEDFVAYQREINQYIREQLQFKFYEVKDEKELISLEHFAIGVLQPKYND